MLERYRASGRAALAALALVGALGAASPAPATTVVYTDVARLTQISDVIVHGRIAGARTFLGEMEQITTEWAVEVAETWKGEERDALTFQQWGGSLDGVTMHIPGDAWFEIGEEVVLFLHGPSQQELYLSALAQSVYRVERDAQPGVRPPLSAGADDVSGVPVLLDLPGAGAPGDEEMSLPDVVLRDLRGLFFWNPEGQGGPVLDIDEVESMTLADLERLVRSSGGAP